MSNDYLPTKVDPIRFAESGVELQGKFLLQDMARLLPSLVNKEGEVGVKIKFGIDRQGIKNATGEVKVSLTLQCQRCLESFDFEMNNSFSYAIVNNDKEVKLLPSHYDPVLTKEGELNILDMVEEELIVNLPIVSMHAPEDCKVHLPIFVAGDPESLEKSENATNPFKVIESLKIKPKQK